jgi:ABC-type multidrug transport system ATPase subunit
MQVELSNISKNFQNHSVFKNVNLVLPGGYKGVILGGNGSGKSTLLKIISTALTPSSGEVEYTINNQVLSSEKRFKHVAFCGPYTEMIEDFSLKELLRFQQSFRPFIQGLDQRTILDIIQLARFEDKHIKTYSSGMKQRVRLALTILSDTPLLLLDEPTSNLDPQGKKWYQNLVEEYVGERSVVVASNHDEAEYFFTSHQIEIRNYQ